MKLGTRLGFSMVETVLTTSVLVLVITAAMGSWLLFMNKSNRVNTQAGLDLDVRKVIERFRSEMRNASRETIMFYPENQPPYQAVGFALASDTDGDGLMDMDASGSNILWRQTVIYHVWNQAPTQMRRTVFDNRNSSAGYSDRYGQIQKVVTLGNGSAACLDGESAKTFVLFENLFTGKLWHAESTFDGYAPDPNTLDRVTFGSMALGPGAHTVDFTIEGKNPLSTGRSFRIDQISAGVCGWPLEAELRTASGYSASPVFVGQGLSGAAYGLGAATASDGDSLSVTVYNDAIEECGFIGKGRNVTLSNTVVRFDTTLQPTGFDDGVYVTRLDGQFASTWTVQQQTADNFRGDFYYPMNCAIRIPIFASYVLSDGFGPVFRFYKSQSNNNLVLSNPSFAIVTTPTDGSMPGPDIDSGEVIPLLFYQDGVQKSGWAACANMAYLELRPAQAVRIEAGATLMVSFQVSVTGYTGYSGDRFTAYVMARHGLVGCWVIPGGDGTTAKKAVWSTDSRLTSTSYLPSLEAISVGYADGGDYVSHPFDTRSTSGAAKTFAWDADVPSGSALTMYVRSGNTLSSDGFDISDALPWANVSAVVNGGVVSGAVGRYLQFRAVYDAQKFSAYPGLTGTTGIGPYRSATPRLRHALFTWDGETKYVDIVGNLLKGPNNGIVQVEVDGKPLVKGVSMEIEIYKDIQTQGAKTERIRSAMMTEIEPRNNNK